MQRLFFALWPDDAVRAALHVHADALRAAGAAGRDVPPARYHLTLRYVGAFERDADAPVDALMHAARQVRAAAFPVKLDRLGCFETARVAWTGCTDCAPGLETLCKALDAALDDADLPPRAQRFVPHVTLMRDVRWRHVHAAVPRPVGWAANEFCLVSSVPGAAYRIIGRWALQ